MPATYAVHSNGSGDPFGRVVRLGIPEPSENMGLEESVQLEPVVDTDISGGNIN
jgi:hypothetical protein